MTHPREIRSLFTPARALFLVAALGVVFGSAPVRAQTSDAAPEAAPTAEEPTFVMPKSGPFAPETIAIPNAVAIGSWARSGHSDASAEAFRHWDAQGEIPPTCATCHSGMGFRAFLGLDGSEPGNDKPVPVGGVVDCETCHNPGLSRITEIVLPSGVLHPVNGGDAACTTCHHGRTAGVDVTKAITGLAEDEVNADLRFINPHYRTAAATMLGGYGGIGYQYPGKEYSGRFPHAKPVATCVSCHDPHSLEVSELTCLTCHTAGEPEAIRISRVSFDGSGDTAKGIKADIQANADRLLSMAQEYASAVTGTGLIFDGESYPYFFADANGDGVADQAEGRPVAFASWTPRLLRAIYNWKVVTADPGVFVHNPPYALELLYDSIEDLSGPLGVNMAELGLLR